MQIGFATDKGKVREMNEDNFFVDKETGLFIVADGMGGYQGGEVASRIAVDVVSKFIKDNIPLLSDKKEDIYKILMESLFRANEKIRIKSNSDMSLKGMGTTIVLVLCRNNGFYISHVGDSRAYLIRQENIKQLTEDHSVVAQMLKAGTITPEEARTHHLKHIITQALGTSLNIIPEIQFFKWEVGEYILLCSDGLTDMLDDQELVSTFLKCKREPEKCCKMLVKLANKKGGKDNITVIILYKDLQIY